MNPATYLRVNGPEPWNVCYVEPSIRPDDSRYGLNPNRLQRHTQVCRWSRRPDLTAGLLCSKSASTQHLRHPFEAVSGHKFCAKLCHTHSLTAADGGGICARAL
jgi:hypothetical protein